MWTIFPKYVMKSHSLNLVRLFMPTSRCCVDHAVDVAFLIRLEGCVAKGYVPTRTRPPNKGDVIGQSGATIGIGVDLGQRNENDLIRLGLPDDLIAKLRPYLGKRCRDAQAVLAECPLYLSTNEVEELSAAVIAETIERIAARYDAAVQGKPNACRFDALPWQAQTVITSLAYQYGDNLPRATPRFWKHVTDRNWCAVILELENFGDKYGSRRRKEARLLREMIAALSSST
jgi:type VI secretion system secreted protein VgrG